MSEAGRWGEPYAPQLPRKGDDTGSGWALATYDDLETWIESADARAHGYVFIT
jgi:hypothetical protein